MDLDDALFALENIPTLTTLTLDYSGIGNDGAQALAAVLEKNTTLTMLDLSRNEIGDDGTVVLAAALEKNTTLTTLNLSRNEIGVEGTWALAAALKKNTTLITLYLSDNYIGAEGARALVVGLEKNASLTTLYLWGNMVNKNPFYNFHALLKRNRQGIKRARQAALFLIHTCKTSGFKNLPPEIVYMIARRVWRTAGQLEWVSFSTKRKFESI